MEFKHIEMKESEELENKIGELIRSHNLLASITAVFEKDKYAKQAFEDAKEEVLASGNCSLSSMYAIALKNLIYKAKAYDKEETRNSEASLYLNRIAELEKENRILKGKLDNIEAVLGK